MRRETVTTHQAFSIIELMVVVAILSLLMGLLLPALAKARESARSANCLANLKQITNGFHLLADDNDGRLPDLDDDQPWDLRVQSYLDTDAHVFVCPSDDLAAEDLAAGFAGLSYSWREWFEVGDASASLSGRRLDEVKATDLILVFENLADRHRDWHLNAATVDASARAYSLDEFEDNLARPVR
ncbi:MAG: hypothetical protein Kow00105_13420 [Phycisphaeraceae bacterium]